jgi:queuine tRNA-ribosyltransferase
MTAKVTLQVVARDGAARTGVATTARGTYRTPCFMPVGTRGAVKLLSAVDYERLGAEIVLGNTYHLMLRPGADVVAALGGLAGFTGWPGLSLTDSGGYQVFSLDPDVDDDGVTFRSVYDGSSHRLTPELAVATQELLGADIQMVLDVCPGLPAPREVVLQAVERTASWAKRARASHVRTDQALFGIVQGGTDVDLRAESAQRTVELDFDGYGIGGLSVGEPRDQMLPALAAALAELPDDQPRYLMGVGDPASIVEAVALGVDQFDCVMPTRLGRHGTALTSAGKVQLRNASNARSDEPVDADCGCDVCRRHSRGYLRHLFQVGEPTAARLLTIHNLAWTFALVERLRVAIADGRLDEVQRQVLATWG